MVSVLLALFVDLWANRCHGCFVLVSKTVIIVLQDSALELLLSLFWLCVTDTTVIIRPFHSGRRLVCKVWDGNYQNSTVEAY